MAKINRRASLDLGLTVLVVTHCKTFYEYKENFYVTEIWKTLIHKNT